LRAAFRGLDPTTFTSNELASSYGVIPHSARRLIATLRERGLVEECGIEKSDGAGRPQIAYRIALDRLAEDN
jgi:predicted ArsR family transcriptional regulator